MLNIIIPAAGDGRRFKEAGYEEPKPLIKIKGKPMIQRVVENLWMAETKTYIVTREPKDLFPKMKDTTIINLTEPTGGAVETVLKVKDIINNDTPLIVANCDQLLLPKKLVNIFFIFCSMTNYDSVIMTFNSTNPHHSYLRVHKGLVVEAAEKELISDIAVAGIYFFRKGSDFVKYAEEMIEKDIRYNGEFYISSMFNLLVADGKSIRPYEVDAHNKVMIGTPEELNIFLDKLKEGDIKI